MRTDVDRSDNGVVVTSLRDRDRTEMRLGLTIDERMAACAIGADRGEQTLHVGDCLWRQSFATHCGELRLQLSVAEAAKQDTTDRSAEGRQPIADIDST